MNVPARFFGDQGDGRNIDGRQISISASEKTLEQMSAMG